MSKVKHLYKLACNLHIKGLNIVLLKHKPHYTRELNRAIFFKLYCHSSTIPLKSHCTSQKLLNGINPGRFDFISILSMIEQCQKSVSLMRNQILIQKLWSCGHQTDIYLLSDENSW